MLGLGTLFAPLFHCGEEPWSLPLECKTPPVGAREGIVSARKVGSRVPWIPPFARWCVPFEKNQSLELVLTIQASNFVLGPKGASLDFIEAVTKVEVYTWNKVSSEEVSFPTRYLRLEGSLEEIRRAACLISGAVLLYKALTEGKYEDQAVPNVHKLGEILYRYRRPRGAPKAAKTTVHPVLIEVLRTEGLSESEREARLSSVGAHILERDVDFIRRSVPKGSRDGLSTDEWMERKRELWKERLGDPVVMDHDAAHGRQGGETLDEKKGLWVIS